ncbi:MAGE-domain-containing protein [Tilletiaria anomala UBC 951]|uniref:MAGE-domain-containing protein n=1 Tax=Tilletiaria anomala (strain ATCC 24038 / CBS 436.72 / UBC 951) TaxID=1037660 RepID=A0A066VPI2_TILAU|nr:MAGE-domain-containing protein [Tilletiaria anomala UBC 951]KDN40689.1 MAGE-domain-containing protein [Tilletiaria anomala UBC 951]
MPPRKASASSKDRLHAEEEDEMEDEEEEDVQLGGANAEDSEPEDLGVTGLRLLTTIDVVVKQSAVNAAKGMEKDRLNVYVRELCRLALFCEYKRIPLKREDITKKAFGSDRAATRAFPYIFRKAQKHLRKTFAFEMVEIRARGTESEALARQRRVFEKAAEDSRGQKAKTNTQTTLEEGREITNLSGKMWMVRSVLPLELRTAMTTATNRLASAAANADGVKALQGMRAGDDAGIMLDWRRGDGQQGSMGLLFFVLGLILVSGRQLSDQKLRSYLNRLSLSEATILPRMLRPDDTPAHDDYGHQTATAPRKPDSSAHTVGEWLDLMIKQQYLETLGTGSGTAMQVISTSTSASVARKRAAGNVNRSRAAANQETFEWKWGGRAEVEIGEEAVAHFMVDIMAADSLAAADHDAVKNEGDEDGGEDGGEDGDEQPKRAGSKQQQQQQSQQRGPSQAQLKREAKQREYIMKNLERSVGSQLVN